MSPQCQTSSKIPGNRGPRDADAPMLLGTMLLPAGCWWHPPDLVVLELVGPLLGPTLSPITCHSALEVGRHAVEPCPLQRPSLGQGPSREQCSSLLQETICPAETISPATILSPARSTSPGTSISPAAIILPCNHLPLQEAISLGQDPLLLLLTDPPGCSYQGKRVRGPRFPPCPPASPSSAHTAPLHPIALHPRGV